MEKKQPTLPLYIGLADEIKASLGYLTVKRVIMTLKRYERLWEIFQISEMKEAFQWFDKEKLWEYFHSVLGEYYTHPRVNTQDASLYALTDFFVWFINYDPNTLSEIISYHLKNCVFPDHKEIELINHVFSPTGFIYEKGYFYSSSFEPSINIKVEDLLSIKLKNINEDLYKTWQSIKDDIISQNPDKATNISAKSRKVLNGLLRELTPGLRFEDGESDQVRKRLEMIFSAQGESQVLERVSSLITALNQAQAKGDHWFINENLAIFTFQLTGLVIFYILSNV